MRTGIREYADVNLPLRKLASAGANDAAKERPFVTNRLWSIFFVLEGLYARNSYKESRFVNWRTDSGCDQLLRAILPAQAVERAKGQPFGGLRTAIDALESKFLAEAGMDKPHEWLIETFRAKSPLMGTCDGLRHFSNS